MKRDKQTNNGQHNTTPKIEDWATHKFEDNKEVISSRKSKDRHYNGQEKKDKTANSGRHSTTQKIKNWTRKQMSEDTKGANIRRKSKKDRQYNGQTKKDKQWYTKHCTEN
jgi:hypothetical protein